MSIAVIDCLAHGSKGRRLSTLDVIGVGPRLIAGILDYLGVKYEYFVGSDVFRDPDVLRDFNVLLVSGMSTDLTSMTKLIRLWGRDGVAIAGGPACVEYERLLRGGYDVVVWGEAEDKIPQVVKEVLTYGKLVSDVPGVFRVVDGKVFGELPCKYLSPELLWRYTPSVKVVRRYRGWWAARVYVEVVRGCSNFYRPTIKLVSGVVCSGCGLCRSGDLELRVNCPLGIPPGCGYCSVPHLYGPARSRPVSLVLSEVKELVKLGVSRVVLSAPDFLDYGRDWLVTPKPLTDPREPKPNLVALEELLSKLFEISEIASGEVYVTIENIKPNLIDRSVAELLSKYLRGTSVGIGLETGDNRLHKALGRPSTVGEVVKAVELLHEYGLKPHIYLIHGLPLEDDLAIRNTIKVVRKLSKFNIEKFTLYRFTPIKYTAFEGFPKPKPAVKSRTTRKLYDVVKELNIKLKERLIGNVVKAVVVSRRGSYLITYPLPHGPVTYVRSSTVGIGSVVLVRVTKVLNDREVFGDVVGVVRGGNVG
jgi:radical SAM superfamily enzyme YgiQ (UPF0313 family)